MLSTSRISLPHTAAELTGQTGTAACRYALERPCSDTTMIGGGEKKKKRGGKENHRKEREETHVHQHIQYTHLFTSDGIPCHWQWSLGHR